MSDIGKLEQQILADIAAAADEAALEAVRVAALGRNGTITALLKTLGAMTPDERRVQGPLINGLKDKVTDALDRAPRRAQERRARRAPQHRDRRRHAAGARAARRSRAASIRSAR